MTFKQFVDWCNERACDGKWGIKEFYLCNDICNHIMNTHFWKRKKEWKRIENDVVNEIVNPINKKIEEWKSNPNLDTNKDKSTRYRTKPCEIEAIQFTGGGDSFEDVDDFCDGALYIENDEPVIKTLEGDMHVSVNDYIIKGLNGEFYPCKPDIFEKKYERI